MSQQVKKTGESPGSCREYFVDEYGTNYARQDDGIGSNVDLVWYVTDKLYGEPGFHAVGEFEVVTKFTDEAA